MPRKIESKFSKVKGTRNEVRQRVLVDGVCVFDGTYWSGSEKSEEAHDAKLIKSLERYGVPDDEIDAFLLSI
ncbi:MAG: hypothetical protein KDI12_24155 [Anaerolineae bacterium]|nr:hypothetical protein [Anaerolineae bacterium]